MKIRLKNENSHSDVFCNIQCTVVHVLLYVVLVCKCTSSIGLSFPGINVDINIFSVKKCNIDSSAPGSSCKQIKINKSQKRTKNFPCQCKTNMYGKTDWYFVLLGDFDYLIDCFFFIHCQFHCHSLIEIHSWNPGKLHCDLEEKGKKSLYLIHVSDSKGHISQKSI